MKPEPSNKTISMIIILGVTVMFASCGTIEKMLMPKSENSFKPNELQSKHYAFEFEEDGSLKKCYPIGKLKELTEDPYHCRKYLDNCKAAHDALSGDLDPQFLELFSDLLVTDPKYPNKNSPMVWRPSWCSDHVDYNTKLAIRGIGYAKDSKHLPDILNLLDDKKIMKEKHAFFENVSEVLWWMGDKEKAIPAYVKLLNLPMIRGFDGFKYFVLKALARWKSDAAVDYCLNTLSNEEESSFWKSCIMYLGNVGVKKAVPLLARKLEKFYKVVIRSLGQIGDPSVIPTVVEFFDQWEHNEPNRLLAAVALVNLGQTKYFDYIKTCLTGKKPLSEHDLKELKEDNEREKEAMRRMKGKSLARYKERIKQRQAEQAQIWDAKLIQQAAMECVLLKDKNMIDKAIVLLRQAAKKRDRKKNKWEAYIYANVALAQMGDQQAADILASELVSNSTKENIRLAILEALGANDGDGRDDWHKRGIGSVGNKSLIPAVLKFYKAETNKGYKRRALKAAVTIRAMADSI
jgi:HEAT repeat protein